jgi:hypothetical protein
MAPYEPIAPAAVALTETPAEPAVSRRPDDADEDFTLDHYREILAAIRRSHATLSFRDAAELGRDILKLDRFVLMRHDVEFSLPSALRIAELDHEAGIRSTFFLLFSSDYNLFEPESAALVRRILDLGHDVGLHYDLLAYERAGADPAAVARRQIELVETYWDTKVYATSCHLAMRAGRTLELPGVVDAYDPLYVDDVKYVSDSTQKWREGVVTSLLDRYDKIHLLMHEYYWSEEGHPFDVLLLREAHGKYNELVKRAEANIATYKQGLKLRARRDAEFRRRRDERRRARR